MKTKDRMINRLSSFLRFHLCQQNRWTAEGNFWYLFLLRLQNDLKTLQNNNEIKKITFVFFTGLFCKFNRHNMCLTTLIWMTAHSFLRTGTTVWFLIFALWLGWKISFKRSKSWLLQLVRGRPASDFICCSYVILSVTFMEKQGDSDRHGCPQRSVYVVTAQQERYKQKCTSCSAVTTSPQSEIYISPWILI